MPRSHKEVEILIVKLEHNLREAMLWSSSVPSVEALQSQLPFALDTMLFEEWLQFVFIPKMSVIINSKSTLPNNIQLLPMAEQCFDVTDNKHGLMQVIKQIDSTSALS
ncbi:MAG: hypothetical protein ACI936_000371 [Paraglaciecola sp.]|jgi:uncharacterized protein YqcC (DUF446 family)